MEGQTQREETAVRDKGNVDTGISQYIP